MRIPTADTKIVTLLGDPLGHSFSSRMHNRVFEKMNLNYLYLPVEVAGENLKTVFSGLTKMNLAGSNVTIPHKVRIMDHIDELDPLAEAVGAVNTICFENGKTKGYNTDGQGFLRSLEEETGISVSCKRVFILGCGGAVRAVAMTLADRQAQIYICNRTFEKAERLSAEINERFGLCCEAVSTESRELGDVLRGCDVLINGTSLGMHPHEDQTPIDEGMLFNDLIVADIVYNPVMTRLLTTAQNMGCRIVTGLGMLVYQGAEAFELWTGLKPPVDDMFETVRAEVSSRR